MKRTLYAAPYIAIPALALAALVGCTTATAPADTTYQADRVVENTIPDITEPITADQRAGKLISEFVADEGVTIDQRMAARYAEIICDSADDGLSFDTIQSIATSSLPRFSKQEHGYLIGASLITMCPETVGLERAVR